MKKKNNAPYEIWYKKPFEKEYHKKPYYDKKKWEAAKHIYIDMFEDVIFLEDGEEVKIREEN